MYVIPKGIGFHVGVNFARATADLPLQVAEFRGPLAFGFIPAQPDAPFEFLRSGRLQTPVYVHVNRDLLRDDA